jgi:hypothetical protein
MKVQIQTTEDAKKKGRGESGNDIMKEENNERKGERSDSYAFCLVRSYRKLVSKRS